MSCRASSESTLAACRQSSDVFLELCPIDSIVPPSTIGSVISSRRPLRLLHRCAVKSHCRYLRQKAAIFFVSLTSLTMAGGATSGPLSTTRRRALAGQSGWAGLVHNRRIFLMAVFASLGGLLYGYNQGVFSGVLKMHTFDQRMGDAVSNAGKQGWLVSILELGAWLGVLVTGYFADKLSRKYTIVLAVVVFCIGVIVQTTAKASPSIYGGRFVTGLGVGSLSMAVPLYNSEISPPEAITFGIMVSFWIDFGTNYIGGNGPTQKEAAWRLPIALQLIPAVILGIGILWMPFSPRWLVNQGRNEEALAVLSYARGMPEDSDLVQIEYLEIKAQYLFEKETSEKRFPQYQDGTFWSNFKLGFFAYLSLLQERSLLYRVAIGTLTMFFQQWTGINAILYYAPTIFQSLGLTGNALSLLATGVVGIAYHVLVYNTSWQVERLFANIHSLIESLNIVIYIDQIGRRPVLISGAFLMAACHFIVAILTGLFHNSWDTHVAAGWAACVMVWIFSIGFGYSWGPCAWIIIAEIWPLSVRGKGVSIAASSNWMNNFIVGQVTPTMLTKLGFGTFVFFGAFSFLGGLFILFFVPETKGVSLEEMEEVFGSTTGIALEDQARLEAIHRRLGLFDDSPQETKNDPEAKGSEERASQLEQSK
ncbi:MFS glucose transporter mfs1 [Mycena sanguinolenta]|uniref:MFS glucose transporter mfs1 n=1 Tax=Mycena sanguinolenta TaxID=230812 RepID=A0A8H6Z9L4_9AGAR|nr:MFS glucose transporter mfs1 [Mycena sanguinolenta]